MPTIQPFKISSLHAWSHDITIYFMPIKIRHIPLADFVTFPTPAPPRLPEMSCWNPSSSCYFTYGRQIIIYPVKEKLLSIYMTLDEAKGWGTGRTINWTSEIFDKTPVSCQEPCLYSSCNKQLHSGLLLQQMLHKRVAHHKNFRTEK